MRRSSLGMPYRLWRRSALPCLSQPGRVAQSVGHLTRKEGVLGSIPGLATYFRFSFPFSRRAVVSFRRKYMHEVLVKRLGGLSLHRKCVVRLTDRPDMTLDVYRGRKTTIQPTKIVYLRLVSDSRVRSGYLDLVVVPLDIARMECHVARRQIEPNPKHKVQGCGCILQFFSDNERCYWGCQRARQSRLRY